MADRVNSLLADLKRLKVETGALACMGCGREHNCGVHGCAVLREAADVLQEYVNRSKRYADEIMALREWPRWILVTERLPESFVPVIVCRDGAPGERIVEQGHKDVGGWWKVYGTRTKRVTHWMPLPDAPEVTCDG